LSGTLFLLFAWVMEEDCQEADSYQRTWNPQVQAVDSNDGQRDEDKVKLA
jgi:hypothetical protein